MQIPASDFPGQEAITLQSEARKIRADIIAIQEVDTAQPRSDHQHQTRDIAQALELPHWHFVPTLVGTPGSKWQAALDQHIHHSGHTHEPTEPHYGIGLASRYPLSDITVLRFPPARVPMPLLVPTGQGNKFIVIGDEPRVALLATAHTPYGPLAIGTAHCSFVPGVNIKQLRAIAKALKSRSGRRILLGDFNIIGKIPNLVTGWSSLAQLRTYPAGNPKVQFDHILGSGFSDSEIQRIQASAQSLPLGMSDHHALVVDAQW